MNHHDTKTASAPKIAFLVYIIWYCAAMILFIDVPYNTMAVGLESKLYLFKMLLDGSIGLVAAMKIWENASGLDHHLHVVTDEGELDIPSFHIPNLWFYGALIAYGGFMLVQAVGANSESTGFESIGFLIWCAADFFVCVGSVFNLWVAWQISQRLVRRIPDRDGIM